MKQTLKYGFGLAALFSMTLLISCNDDNDQPLVLDACECYEILSQGLESNMLYDTCNQALHADDEFIVNYTKCQYAAITGHDVSDVVIPKNKAPEISIPSNGTYSLNVDESEARFIGRNSILNKKEKARFNFKEGTIVIKDSTLVDAHLVIDILSLTNMSKNKEKPNDKLVKHLLSDDFLSAEKYPTATFEMTGSNNGTFKLKVEGLLTIKGVSKPISFHTSLIESDGELVVGGSFVINRTDFGINYNSGSIFSDLGDEVIEDEVPVAFNIKANKISD